MLTAQMMARIFLDAVMPAAMMMAMGCQLTGGMAHEIIGLCMGVMFAVHVWLNRHWYRVFLSGLKNLRGILTVILDLTLTLVMSVLMVSGMIISQDLFVFLHLGGGMAVRQLHTSVAWWGLVLMSIHVGFHWEMVMNLCRRAFSIAAPGKKRSFVLRSAAFFIAAAGLWSSFDQSLWLRLTGQFTFGYWDFEHYAFGFFAELLSIMGLYTNFAYWGLKALSCPHSRVTLV